MNTKTSLTQLQHSGHCVWPGFLSTQSVSETRADFDEIRDAGTFVRAATGQGAERALGDIRRDEIHWLDRDHATAAQAQLWQRLESLKESLNRSLFLGIRSMEGHYAAYSAGGHYRRHRDSFRQDDSRIVSVVIYLNEHWLARDGGRLRMYGDGQTHMDIDPVGGTLVCFLSQEAEHEVMESHNLRASFAGWFKT